MICPFCGKDITREHSSLHSIQQEETAKRDFSIERTWAGSYMKETKSVRYFSVFCCEQCYNEFQKYEKWSDKYIMFSAPIGFIAGISYSIYIIVTKNLTVSFGQIVVSVLFGVLGIFIFSFPNLILYILYGKRTSYKNALKCNAIHW